MKEFSIKLLLIFVMPLVLAIVLAVLAVLFTAAWISIPLGRVELDDNGGVWFKYNDNTKLSLKK